MAGAYWHFLAATKTLDSLSNEGDFFKSITTSPELRSTFLAGVQGPDFNFYPGGDGAISKFAHGDVPADLGREMLALAETSTEKAFAYGWLMHLTTDFITHPLVNQLIVKHFPEKCQGGEGHNAYPLGHHRVEWGIDIFLLQQKPIQPHLPDLGSTLEWALPMDSLVSRAYDRVFNYKIESSSWTGAVKGMITYEALFRKIWSLSGRFQESNPLKRVLKEMGYQLLVKPVSLYMGRKSPDNGAGVFIPIQPTTEDFRQILERVEQVRELYLDFLKDDFKRLENTTN